jgi:hypothetical protein
MFIYGLKTQKGQLKSLFSNFQACDSSWTLTILKKLVIMLNIISSPDHIVI